ncbi:ABC transporter permease [Rhodovulum sp. DZ06]|uniref:ABC transporter permease n=1 Tax=Rhodovulum sp. DZ06 TaxID=3425126 RepID=UPI003D33F978
MAGMDVALDLWDRLPLDVQDGAVALALLAPGLLAGALACRGLRPWTAARALLRRNRGLNLLLAGLMALSVGLGAALTAQERALREGAARAADPFDVIVAAPGDRISLMLAAVYLEPTDAPLLGGEVLARLQADPRAALVAPIAFGDSVGGAPLVGSTAGFVARMGGVAEGRVFETRAEAVVGALSPLAPGASFTPAHGAAGAADEHAHEGEAFTVVGRLAPTGSPWDRAVVVPVEAVWDVHGLADGHAPGAEAEADHAEDHAGHDHADHDEQDDHGTHADHGHEAHDAHDARARLIGPPFDPAYFPGTPAFLVSGDTLWANYALRNDYDRDGAMAFLPGAELARLHGVLGDVRRLMSLMAGAAQALVAAGALAGLAALARLFAPRLALARALGAPRRYTLAVMWSYAAALVGAAALLGLPIGWAGAQLASSLVAERTGVAMEAALGWPEIRLAAAFFSSAAVLALAPAALALRRDPREDLRGR